MPNTPWDLPPQNNADDDPETSSPDNSSTEPENKPEKPEPEQDLPPWLHEIRHDEKSDSKSQSAWPLPSDYAVNNDEARPLPDSSPPPESSPQTPPAADKAIIPAKAEPSPQPKPSAQNQKTQLGPQAPPPYPLQATQLAPDRAQVKSNKNGEKAGRNKRQSFILGLQIAFVMVGVLLACGLATSIIGYATIAAQLPAPRELIARQFQFRTTTIVDRNGELLWEINDPNFGRRTDVNLANIAPELIEATVATEDRNFYINVGVDPIAIARAVYYNVTEGTIVSGASTITQQLAKNVLISPEERQEQSIARKIKEAVLAMELSRTYTKDEIMTVYLNQIYYGNLAYGIEAASRTYFGKTAQDLSLPEAALLAGLPQSPAVHDPYSNPEGAKRRQEIVLQLMVEAKYLNQAEAEGRHERTAKLSG